MPFHRIRRISAYLLLTACLLTSLHSVAAVKIEGTFIATQSCPAFQSIKKKSNPGQHKTTVGEKYQARLLNKPNGDWVQLSIPNAKPSLRWVNIQCGKQPLSLHSTTVPTPKKQTDSKQCQTAGLYDSYVLAVSWQPGFCEHGKFKTNKPECAAIKNAQRPVHNLTLHGLWPNRRQCGIQYGYCRPDNKMELSQSTIETIAPWMPNFYYQTDFGQYQWKKHGSCQSRPDDEYFLLATNLVKQVDSSPIGDYIKGHIGRTISIANFEKNMVQALGQQATKRIQLSCLKGRYLQEIRFNLAEDFEKSPSLRAKLEAGPQSRSFKGNCKASIHIED
ncbi:ribonuclease T2 family protein [Photobacterium nomapromontoriensis]|uniref:ribonuclease T2 family protein n=1 Tax=Photobacterium nomapromontoriensis TaxID=2910237 RepID=UPI003D11C55B